MSRGNARPAGFTTVIALLLLFTLGVTLYWISFYTSGDVNLSKDDQYLSFERAFTAADLMTAAFTLIAAIGLLLRRPFGLLFGLVAPGGILFLGVMDISYDLAHDVYLTVSGAMITEAIVNLFCIVSAPLMLAVLWRGRRKLGA